MGFHLESDKNYSQPNICEAESFVGSIAADARDVLRSAAITIKEMLVQMTEADQQRKNPS